MQATMQAAIAVIIRCRRASGLKYKCITARNGYVCEILHRNGLNGTSLRGTSSRIDPTSKARVMHQDRDSATTLVYIMNAGNTWLAME